ncbi:hypothetical protein QSJ19_18715 [Gordonia sp. ABSL11-1]|uniref:hypothetical protein n=1 Tax=Gordonia sp. ABSL11-1 TaxID=3053924 RepID=UPI002572BE5F|nr:hypothetical protein [Gordonia sp. ABSL11-1]MDL9947578.1 hypothetical protein [Gordonia sp. ABSL11-1]
MGADPARRRQTVLLLGLPVMYAWLAPRIGIVGLVGVIAYTVGNLVTATGQLTVELFVAYPLAHLPAAHLPATAGLIADDDTMLSTTAFAMLNTEGGLVMLGGPGLLGASLIRHRHSGAHRGAEGPQPRVVAA